MTETPKAPPAKPEVVALFLEKGPCMLHLDARRFGVRVPKEHRVEWHLRLNFSYRFRPADLAIDAHGIKETLSFGGTASPVSVPWHAVWGATAADGRTVVWPESVPPEGAAEVADAAPAPAEAPKAVPEPVEDEASEIPPDEPPPKPRPAGRPHLKLVK